MTQQPQEGTKSLSQSMTDVDLNANDILIAVMGVTGSGKSTFIKLLTQQEVAISHGMVSCTSEVAVYDFMFKKQRVFLIDTPGFDDTHRSDTEVLKDIAFWLAESYKNKVELAGLVFLHRITDPKMQGAALKNLSMFKKLCGEDNLASVVLATTHWTNEDGPMVTEATGRARIEEMIHTPNFWGNMVEAGSTVERHDGTEASAKRIVSKLIERNDRVVLDIQHQMVDQNMTLDDTAAGQALQGEILAERQRSAKALRALKEDMEDATRENNEKWQEEIQADRLRMEKRMQDLDLDRENMKVTLEKIMEEKDQKHRQEMGRLEAEMRTQQVAIAEQTQLLKQAQEEASRSQRAIEEEKRKWEAQAGQRRYEELMVDRQQRQPVEQATQLQRSADQITAYHQRQAELEAENRRAREEASRRLQELNAANERVAAAELATRKRSRLNPKRWFGNRYRPK